MHVWHNGAFVPLEVLDRQDAYTAFAYPVQIAGRMEGVQVGKDTIARAEYAGHERDVVVLVARAAALAAAQPGARMTVNDAELQQLWTKAGQQQFEKVAAGCLHLLLAARHRGVQLDVFGLAASLQRSVWDVLTGLRILHGYGAIVFDQGVPPDPADRSPQAGRATLRLASEPPDVARLVAFAEALAKTTDGIRA